MRAVMAMNNEGTDASMESMVLILKIWQCPTFMMQNPADLLALVGIASPSVTNGVIELHQKAHILFHLSSLHPRAQSFHLLARI